MTKEAGTLESVFFLVVPKIGRKGWPPCSSTQMKRNKIETPHLFLAAEYHSQLRLPPGHMRSNPSYDSHHPLQPRSRFMRPGIQGLQQQPLPNPISHHCSCCNGNTGYFRRYRYGHLAHNLSVYFLSLWLELIRSGMSKKSGCDVGGQYWIKSKFSLSFG